MSLTKVASNKTFGGSLTKYKFKSTALGGLETQFNLFLPREAENGPVPVLYYLAGLTCNEDTGPWKAGIIREAAIEGIAMVFPDTSPRGANLGEEETKDWDFGTGAGFYLNATKEGYSKYYNMSTMITVEIPEAIKANGLPVDLSRASITGHSMGGHGSLTLYLASLSTLSPYISCSAFSPISRPTDCPWGEKAFKGYLSGGVEEGKKWDATELLPAKTAPGGLKIKIDVGTADQFYIDGQLKPEAFLKKARELGYSEDEVAVEMREGYDHSYYFISTFVADHVKFHAQALKK